MYKFRTLLLFALCAMELAVAPAANAGSVGHVGQVGQVPGVISVTAGSANTASSPNFNTTAPVNIGNVVNNNLASGIGNSTIGAGIFSTNNINVQTNIDSSKNIEVSSTLNVTDSINGSNIDYGLNGANVLNVIDGADAFASQVSSENTAGINAVAADALLAAQYGN